ncbi:hypothetical protein D3C86_583960 [compost metagenome]
MVVQCGFHGRAEQCNGMHRLAQVVTGRGKKAGLFRAGSLHGGDAFAQLCGEHLVLELQHQGGCQPLVLLHPFVQCQYQIGETEERQKPVQRATVPDQGKNQPAHHGDAAAEHGPLDRPTGLNGPGPADHDHDDHNGRHCRALDEHEEQGAWQRRGHADQRDDPRVAARPMVAFGQGDIRRPPRRKQGIQIHRHDGGDHADHQQVVGRIDVEVAEDANGNGEADVRTGGRRVRGIHRGHVFAEHPMVQIGGRRGLMHRSGSVIHELALRSCFFDDRVAPPAVNQRRLLISSARDCTPNSKRIVET